MHVNVLDANSKQKFDDRKWFPLYITEVASLLLPVQTQVECKTVSTFITTHLFPIYYS